MGADNAAEDGPLETTHDWMRHEDEMLADFLITNYGCDEKRPEVAAKYFKWENAGVKGRTPEQCQARWKNLISLVRTYRTTKEVAEDLKKAVNSPTMYKSLRMKAARSHPDFPKGPPNAYLFLFSDIRRKLLAENPNEKYSAAMLAKSIGKAYREMKPKKRKMYEARAAAAREEYAEKVTQFYRDHPSYRELENEREVLPVRPVTPSFMFIKSQLEDADDYQDEDQVPAEIKAELKEEFAELPPKRKAKYVKKALAYQADYADQLAVYSAMQSGPRRKPIFKQICTKEELKLMEKESGEPKKPPTSAYAAFMRDQRKSGVLGNSNSKESMLVLANMWKKVNDDEKAKYSMEVATSKMEYAKQLAEWKASAKEGHHKPKQLTWDSVQTRGVYLYAAETLSAYRKECPTLYEAELRDLIIQDYRKLSKDKRKEYEDRANVSSSWWKRRGRDKTLLFKNEPQRVPRSGYELFVRESLSKEKGKVAMKDLKPIWNALSKADKENFEHRCVDMKKEYSKNFKEFVNGLSAVELAEFKRVRGSDAPNGSPWRGEIHEAFEDIEPSSSENDSSEDEENDSEDEEEEENDIEDEEEEESDSEDEEEEENDSEDEEDDDDSPPALKYGIDQPKQLDEPLISNGIANSKSSQQRKRKPSSDPSSSGEDEEEDQFAAKKLKIATHPISSHSVQSPSKRDKSPSPASFSSDSDFDSDEEEETLNVSKIKSEPVSPQKKLKKESSDESESDSEDDGKFVPAAQSILDVSMKEGSKSSQSLLVKPSPKPTPGRTKQETDEESSEESEPETPRSTLKFSAKKGSTASPAKPGPASRKKPTSARKEESSSEDSDEEEPPRKPTPAKSSPKPPSALAASWRRTVEKEESSSDDSDNEEPLQKTSLATKSSTQKALSSTKKSARKEDTDEEEEEPPKSSKKSSKKQERAREEPPTGRKAKNGKAGRNVEPAEEVRETSEKEPTAGKKRNKKQVVEEEIAVAAKESKRSKPITSTPMHVEDPKKKKKKKD